ncbi:MAG: thioredoxin-dependent thiol peroxidase [Alphaproteobacteria bacterium CG_4_10_14_0_8_um_filter_53_9]|nr:MAG: thioredoxin-dependent thiol peroxidase [Alphaproteobacteria bacterium CG_4_10_14_0_8_um_filter_53_9]
MLSIGDKVTGISLRDQNNSLISLDDIKSKWVLIYFYPKALTSGCTVQACALRDAEEDLKDLDITVLGVSPDAPALLKKFEDKEGLNFSLLSDEDHSVAEKFGVWVEKSMYGRTYMGMTRASFLIDNTGVIRMVWPKVKPADHLNDILTWVRTQPSS